ncbi:hypothetical protein NLI96_g516 [Meripilus lineatus]|uniref:Uncharacterized protein n=1 Tax=Meripilus lineatus TaxID=2056292 RepID=A0AAD5VC66_9APHY|nr:hypothetical protein NLI96_g516 [Physisporinus lineatus]
MAVNAVKERSEQDGRDMRTIMDEAMRKIENRQQDTRNVIDEIMRNLDENLRRMDSRLEPEEYKVTTSSPSTWMQGATPVTENPHRYERRSTSRSEPSQQERPSLLERGQSSHNRERNNNGHAGNGTGRNRGESSNAGPPGPPDGSGGNDSPSGSENEGSNRDNRRRSDQRRARTMTPFPDQEQSRIGEKFPTYHEKPMSNQLYTRDSRGRVVDNSLTWITATIDERLGEPIEDHNRNVKMKEPERYDGANDLDMFDDWVLDITRWMAISQLGGPKKEKMRILTLGQLLSKKALVWYRSEIESPFRARREWTFVDIVCGLFDHFVHKTSGKVAGEKFRSVQYDAKKGVSQLYTEMMKHASRMVEVPSEYDQSIVFVKALPEEFRKALRISRKIKEERNTLMEIYYNAMDIEEAIQTDKRQKENQERVEKLRVEDRGRDYRPPTEDRNREHRSRFEDQNKHNRSRGEGGHYASRHRQSRERERDRSTNRPEGNQNSHASHVKTPEEPRRRDEGKKPSSSRAAQGTHQRHQEYRPEKEKEKEKDGPRISDKSYTLQSNLAIRRVEEASSGSDELDESDSAEEMESGRDSSEQDTDRRGHTRFRRRSPGCRHDESESSYNSDQSLADSREGYGSSEYESDESEHTPIGEHTESSSTNDEDYSEDSASYRAMSIVTEDEKDSNGDPPELRNDDKSPPNTLARMESRPKLASKRLTAYVDVNGRNALALFDSGSSIDAINHKFARVVQLKLFSLRKPVCLRLGTNKDQSRIDFGVYMRMSVNGVEAETYLDIADIGRYDIVFGAPSMLKYGMSLDFEHRVVRIRGGDAIDSITLVAVKESEVEMMKMMTTHREKQISPPKTRSPQTRPQFCGGGGRPSVELPVILKPNTHQVNFHSKFTQIPAQNASNEQQEGRSHESSHLRHNGRGSSLVESPRRTCVMQQGASQYTGMPNEEENIPVTPSEMGDYPMQIITDDRTTSGLAKIPKPAPDAIHRHARENANAGVGRGEFGVLEGVIDVAGIKNKSEIPRDRHDHQRKRMGNEVVSGDTRSRHIGGVGDRTTMRDESKHSLPFAIKQSRGRLS